MRFAVNRFIVLIASLNMVGALAAADGSRFATGDSDARYVHHIDLYDANNRKITADSEQPYSSAKTCGRCHEYETISHGWHFNAFHPDSVDGRQGEPWIWTDARTGTQLPLSYRDWQHTYDPKKIGITPWDMTRHFGGRIPGGGVGTAPPDQTKSDRSKPDEQDSAKPTGSQVPNRWEFSGSLEIDCMICHAVSGQYDSHARQQQIERENFAWAPTAALRLGVIRGNASRIKDGSDPKDAATKKKLPKVTYDPNRFDAEGKVFMDLVRHPESNACYQCHSTRMVSEQGLEPRWIHDEDVHLRAGMQCSDCHRNGLDHHIVRGHQDEDHPGEHSVATLSCSGCHLGTGSENDQGFGLAGRLGSPKPLHAGLPPVHFEKLSCTACHGGPLPRDETLRMMTSLAHGLGEKTRRTGQELPTIVGPVYTQGASGQVHPHRAMWPAFWGMIREGKIDPIPPNQVYDWTRRILRVRKNFSEELLKPRLSKAELKEVLGEDRYRTKEDEWTEEEATKIEDLQTTRGRELFDQKVSEALSTIEKELEKSGAVYVSSGIVYGLGDEEGTLRIVDVPQDQATQMVEWPVAHNVRPAGWSLGIHGCTECHSEEAPIFTSTVTAVGPGPHQAAPITMATLQGVDADQRLAWNQLFSGRAKFKYVIAGSLTILVATLLLGIGSAIGRLNRSYDKKGQEEAACHE